MDQPCQILFIDAYDSFSNNIVALVREYTNAHVTTVKVDDARYSNGHLNSCGEFARFLSRFDAVIAGPGPGSPTNQSDVGLIAQLWHLPESDLLPVLGICLGFQSLAHAHGAKIEPLAAPQHGLVARVIHRNESIFRDVGKIHATQYNSLHVILDEQQSFEESQSNGSISPCSGETVLRPLAWTKPDNVNGPILMAVQHMSKPFWGVQYHPESICTNKEGARILTNWWEDAKIWNKNRGRIRKCPASAAPLISDFDPQRDSPTSSSSESLFGKNKTTRSPPTAQADMSWKSFDLPDLDVIMICETLGLHNQETVLLESGTGPCGRPVDPLTGRFSIISCDKSAVSERLQYDFSSRQLITSIGCNVASVQTVDDIWLHLEQLMKERRRYTGCTVSPFWGGFIGYVTYEAGLGLIDVEAAEKDAEYPDLSFTFVERSIVIDHVEMKIYVQSVHSDDMPWISHIHATLLGNGTFHGYVGNLIANTRKWLTQFFCPTGLSNTFVPSKGDDHRSFGVEEPAHDDYISRIKRCQSLIRAGESYELCLTGQTTVPIPKAHASWSIYRRLRDQNPASHCAYLQFAYFPSRNPEKARTEVDQITETLQSNLTILSSSPERFLSWTRPTRQTARHETPGDTQSSPSASRGVSSVLQYRPIKGTVPKSTCKTLAAATAILNQPKERAENLMIVDLIRHDLHGVAQDVVVTDLMRVEEARNVWHLVSVIEGTMSWDDQNAGSYHAATTHGAKFVPSLSASRITTAKSPIAALATSLPPGSMTGAPKKRSCTLLVDLETQTSPNIAPRQLREAEARSISKDRKARGIYSGVFGFLDVGGAGEWAVAIRCAWNVSANPKVPLRKTGLNDIGRPKKELLIDECDHERWHIGAGGAITTLSDPEAEWEEMLQKRAGVLNIFTELRGSR